MTNKVEPSSKQISIRRYRRAGNDSSADTKPLQTEQLQQDIVAIEEPLQVLLSVYSGETNSYQQRALTITMRTPGHDSALITGLLLSEGIITTPSDIVSIEINNVEQVQEFEPNIALVTLAEHIGVDWPSLTRQFASHSSCGLCGKSAVKALALRKSRQTEDQINKLANDVKIGMVTLFALAEKLQVEQLLFAATGAVHGAGFYCNGEMQLVREDVGRHNALDKLIGQLALNQHNTSNGILVLSGRVSFDLMQKAILANIKVIVAVGAPSSLAILAAQQFDITLIGFTKVQQFNVYHGHWRISSK